MLRNALHVRSWVVVAVVIAIVVVVVGIVVMVEAGAVVGAGAAVVDGTGAAVVAGTGAAVVAGTGAAVDATADAVVVLDVPPDVNATGVAIPAAVRTKAKMAPPTLALALAPAAPAAWGAT